uniref:Uncharacterized protein n=1 Tax=Onchocerca volvulus TaxID=6282 RepID=A0A8R1TRR3_ONCVO
MTLAENKLRDDRVRYRSRDPFWDSDRWYRDWDDWPLDWPRPGELVRRVSFLLFARIEQTEFEVVSQMVQKF